jgi:hypothetical protein
MDTLIQDISNININRDTAKYQLIAPPEEVRLGDFRSSIGGYDKSEPHGIQLNLDDILCGSDMTKEKRAEQFGSVSGNKGSILPEQYQRNTIIKYTEIPCAKSKYRINLETLELVQVKNPNNNPDGFNYTEDFDGIQKLNDKTIYINMKCIVGSGGSQTRSLREVYWFIKGQLDHTAKFLTTDSKIYFANILDGDIAAKHMDKFKYLINKDCYNNIKNKVFIGNLKSYIYWFKTLSKIL